MTRLTRTAPPQRARLVALAGRLLAVLVEQSGAAAPLGDFLPLLFDSDPIAARQAAVALGKLPPELSPHVEPALLERFLSARDPADRRALAEALGKLGGERALTALRTVDDKSPLLSQIVERATLRLERSISRPSAGASGTWPAPRLDRELPGPYRVVLRCRAGLAAIVADELRARGLVAATARLTLSEPLEQARRSADPGFGRVSFETARPLSELFQVRTFSSLAIALPVSSAGDAADLEDLVAAALTDPRARALLAVLSDDPRAVRYRLHFEGGGHRRALVWRIAAAVRRRAPELLNDPKASPFSVEICDGLRGGAISIELVPRIVDPRFVHHVHDVPAASHPPLAAALVRLAEVGPDDVVWDPFVGSGTELLEVALGTPCHRLFGTDLDAAALAAARENLAAASTRGCPAAGAIELFQADALTFSPPGRRLTRIVTNPPMGRRTRPGELSTFLSAFIDRAAALLAPGGRLVWISPQPRVTTPRARARGLTLLSQRSVDMHGFLGSLEVWQKPRKP